MALVDEPPEAGPARSLPGVLQHLPPTGTSQLPPTVAHPPPAGPSAPPASPARPGPADVRVATSEVTVELPAG